MTEIGAVLGEKYQVLAKLGEGGMGVVFRAENLLTGKQVALKCMHPRLTDSKEATERLLREARAACSLSHPNVVDVYDVMYDGERVFLVMELLQGETLRDFLERNPHPKISEFVALMLPAVAGVAAAHERGVIHRDLKPDNIFLERVLGMPNGVAKVLDFGIAKVATAKGQTLTQTGVALGTPVYMSLEQLRGDKDVDGRADVYAFGVMFYEAVTGQMPHDGATLPELVIKVATMDARPVKELRPDVPTSLARIIDWAIARERSQRLPDVKTLLRELEVFARDHSFRDQMTHPGADIPRLQTDVSAAAEDSDTLRARELITVRVASSRLFSRWLLAGASAVALTLIGMQFVEPKPAEAPAVVTSSAASPNPSQPAAARPEPELKPTPDALLAGPSPLPAPGAPDRAPPSAPKSTARPTAATAASQPAAAAVGSNLVTGAMAAPVTSHTTAPAEIKDVPVVRSASKPIITAPAPRLPVKQKSATELIGF